jgi:hypothetical protein
VEERAAPERGGNEVGDARVLRGRGRERVACVARAREAMGLLWAESEPILVGPLLVRRIAPSTLPAQAMPPHRRRRFFALKKEYFYIKNADLCF